jgi:glucose-6-phosphate isomerase
MVLDLSKIQISEDFIRSMQPSIVRALYEMDKLEKGLIANPDEGRMVGHYWLRKFELAPSEEIRRSLHENLVHIQDFSEAIRSGTIKGEKGPFTHLLCVGIGGSALGPQLLSEVLGVDGEGLDTFFIDNTDPDGIHRILKKLEGHLGKTLVLVMSKSGGTPEPRNALMGIRNAYQKEGLRLEKHGVAVTQPESPLDRQAATEGWLDRFPLWDWVGGRTSFFSSVGLLPAALQGIDISGLMGGATEMDIATRHVKYAKNPAMLLALAWYAVTNGKGTRNMVIVPYKDSLGLLARYLQQLVMESLGKKEDLEGRTVHQGLTVYGNKGSTDQHAYIQQLRDGLDDFFVTFIEVLHHPVDFEVETGLTAGDYLEGFLIGTRKALAEVGRPSITLTTISLTAQTLGALVALYERAVGFYASFINVNAYHQPGVEAGKKAASQILSLKKEILNLMKNNPERALSAPEVAKILKTSEPVENIFKLLEYLYANGSLQRHLGTSLADSTYQLKHP